VGALDVCLNMFRAIKSQRANVQAYEW